MKRESAIKKLNLALDYYRYVSNASVKPSTPICIFGMPRGGTTWLAELLMFIYDGRLIWEPLFKYRQYKIERFNPFAYPEQKIFREWTPYQNEHIENHLYRAFFEQLFHLEIRNIKILRFNDFKSFPEKKSNVFKFCFGNLLLPWIVNRFETKSIFLIRHPCAVVASSLAFGHNFDYHKKHYKDWKYDALGLYPEFSGQFEFAHELIDGPESMLTLQWAIYNHYIVRHKMNNSKWLTLAYEDLYLNPGNCIDRIKKFIDRPVNSLNISDLLKTESFSSGRNHSAEYVKQNKQHFKWKDQLTENQKNSIFKMLKALGITYYSEAPEPDYKQLYG